MDEKCMYQIEQEVNIWLFSARELLSAEAVNTERYLFIMGVLEGFAHLFTILWNNGPENVRDRFADMHILVCGVVQDMRKARRGVIK